MTELNNELDATIAELEGAYTKDELLALALGFGVEVRQSMTKKAVATEFAELGVSVELIKGLAPEEDDEEVESEPVIDAVPAPVVDPSDLVLVKMNRKNSTYEIRGYRFTREHPYGLVTEGDADYLIETDGGFAMASPKEARAFYS